MTTKLNPYLNFRDGTREVMAFYASVFGGEVRVSTFAESGGMGMPEDEQGKVMHAQLDTEAGLTVMAADVPSFMEVGTNGTVSLSGEDETELRGYWDKLTEGATITMPLEKAPWGDTFGMLADRFGVSWLMNISAS